LFACVARGFSWQCWFRLDPSRGWFVHLGVMCCFVVVGLFVVWLRVVCVLMVLGWVGLAAF
ncbi:hypothetical protein M5055_01605, partial [Neisseria meningitidis]|nr:hypothetical protein [Neisseria meningitidis]